MLNCREATQLASESQDRKLGLGQQVGLSFHLLICALCRRYARQIDAITRALRSERGRVMQDSAQLDAAARERIRSRLGK